MTHLVLVGGGHAHLSVLRRLAAARRPDVMLTLVTPTVHQNYSGMLPGWMAGHYDLAKAQVDLRPLIAAAGARLVEGRVVALEASARRLRLADGTVLAYDLLSLDVGSETDTTGLEEAGERLLPVKPLDDFFPAWSALLAEACRRRAYRLAVVGGGAAGVELALAATFAFASQAPGAQVALIVPATGLLPDHAPGVQARVEAYAGRAGLVVHRQRATGCAGGVRLADGRLLKFDKVIAATGARPAAWVKATDLAKDQQGYVLVNQHHCSLSHPEVFAAGDVCARTDVRMARSGVHAVFAGPVLANNLLAAIDGGRLVAYKPKARSLYLLACGPRYAIASWGRWSAEGAWVWRWKDWIDRGFVRRFSRSGQ